jgi:hypothetical protein
LGWRAQLVHMGSLNRPVPVRHQPSARYGAASGADLGPWWSSRQTPRPSWPPPRSGR